MSPNEQLKGEHPLGERSQSREINSQHEWNGAGDQSSRSDFSRAIDRLASPVAEDADGSRKSGHVDADAESERTSQERSEPPTRVWQLETEEGGPLRLRNRSHPKNVFKFTKKS